MHVWLLLNLHQLMSNVNGAVLLKQHCHVIIFYRCWQGEVSKTRVEDYRSRRMVDDKSDSMDALSPMERNLCNLFLVSNWQVKETVLIVPVLFLPWHLQLIETLMTHRTQAGVLSTNCYVFAYSHSNNHLCGCDALRNAALKCGASTPNSLTSNEFMQTCGNHVPGLKFERSWTWYASKLHGPWRAISQGCARDLSGRDRDDTRDAQVRDRD